VLHELLARLIAMVYFRSLIYLVFLVVTVVPWGLMSLLLSLILRGERLYAFVTRWLHIAVWGARVICGVRYQVTGWTGYKNWPSQQRLILLVKHQSAWETLAMPVIMPRPLSYVFKRELLYIPFFGWGLGRLDMIHIDRSKRSQAWAKVLEQGQRLLNQGLWVIMFPEGTRTARGALPTYKHGGSRLAAQTQSWIVPIALNSARCWPPKSFVLRPGTIEVCLGEPFLPHVSQSAEQVTAKVQQWIESEMKRLDPEAYVPPTAGTPHA
jgi:1-acyl-sn-glycerol-3-phosphate acyltransferase